MKSDVGWNAGDEQKDMKLKKDTDNGDKPKAASKPKKKSDGADDEESEMFSVSDGEDSAEIWDPLAG